jgi:hypothetical protein
LSFFSNFIQLRLNTFHQNYHMQKEEEEFLKHCHAWDRAIEKNIVDEIGIFMHDDWICVATDGGITTKTGFLDVIASGDLSHTKMTSDEHEIRFYGRTAIFVSKGISSGTFKQDIFSFYEWSTSVFILNESRWLCVLTMLTPAKKYKI